MSDCGKTDSTAFIPSTFGAVGDSLSPGKIGGRGATACNNTPAPAKTADDKNRLRVNVWNRLFSIICIRYVSYQYFLIHSTAV
ncbi:hypothetical protein A3F03_00175 [Candidatus Roizmanbacteria bacterium RIFCSPHIGHO2_12_FULL_41_11]|uniref:Uncharacterized protein n=1 Tax=Candidatus Roizmanbacteria bacterium RIFCSPHIGHO2_12_FULL_41_11 TaxID=1802052 RepID=A0A1F7I3V8_9BACT|nr:MAG: hypothetical protein A3F03_00175 [Candidatus Roizmanbacteria bacterium RIFCSPHIGHO2_12_FULL_41_11]